MNTTATNQTGAAPTVTATVTKPVQNDDKPRTNPVRHSDSTANANANCRYTDLLPPSVARLLPKIRSLPPPTIDPDDFDLSTLPPDFPISPSLKVNYLGELKDEFGDWDDPDEDTNPAQRAAIEDEILEFHRPKSPLDRLPEPVQKLLYDLLAARSLRSVQLCIQRPPPRGLGIKTNHNSLSQFKKRYEDRASERQLSVLANHAKKILAQKSADNSSILSASNHLLNLRLLHTLTDPKSKTRDLCDLAQAHSRMEAVALNRAKLQLAKQARHDKQSSKDKP